MIDLTASAPSTSPDFAPGDVHFGYLAPVSLPFALPTRVYGAMLAVWHLRPVFQRRFPLHHGEPRDYVRFLAWCAAHGRREYAILRCLPQWDTELARQLKLPPLKGDRWAGGYSTAMFLYGVAKYRYTFTPLLTSAWVRARVARTFWRGARHQRQLPPAAQWQRRYMAEHYANAKQLAETLRQPRIDGSATTKELIQAFGFDDLAFDTPQTPSPITGEPAQNWSFAELRRAPVRLPLLLIRAMEKRQTKHAPAPAATAIAEVTARIPTTRPAIHTPSAPFGVNLFGHARGELGIGEDVRLTAQALHANDIPFCIVNVKPGGNVSQKDQSVDQWLIDQPRYAINLFCSTGIELARYICEQGPRAFTNRYTVGLWPWELPHWPDAWQHAYGLVDEIWGISQHTAHAYTTAPCPVHPMTLPVSIDDINNTDRAHFNLPEKTYLFVFSFDYNSSLARKNPAGLIQAFQTAFPNKSATHVGLVLKVSHSNGSKAPAWKKLKASIAADPRIHLIDTTLRKPEVLALYRCCDCFVSLHRAEGFGRGIAEAMLLGLPVITTNYSGNTDFCDPDHVSMVNYRTRPLHAREYPFGDGQNWAEPDINHAAELMQQRAGQGPTTIQYPIDTSPAHVGAKYAERLRNIYQEITNSRNNK